METVAQAQGALADAERMERKLRGDLGEALAALSKAQAAREAAEAKIAELAPEVSSLRHQAEMARSRVGSAKSRLRAAERAEASDLYSRAAAALREQETVA